MPKVVCFDFDDVIVDGNVLSKMGMIFGNRLKEIRLGLQFIRSNDEPKKFAQSVRGFVKMGRGLDFDFVNRIFLKLNLIKGVEKAFKKLTENGYKISIVSANDEGLIREMLKKYRIDTFIDHIYASKLCVKNGKLTGAIIGEVIDTEKLGVVKKIENAYKISKKDITYIGDGLTDLPIIKAVGKGILFCPNTITRARVYTDEKLKKKEASGQLFWVEKKDLGEVLKFIN